MKQVRLAIFKLRHMNYRRRLAWQSLRRVGKGFTVIEMLITMAVISVVMVAVSTFLTRSLAPSPLQFERGRIIQLSRTRLHLMAEHVREADVSDARVWLARAEPYRIEFYAHVDDSGTARLVRYWLAGSVLNQRIGGGGTQVLARHVVNRDEGQPLFTYDSVGGHHALDIGVSEGSNPSETLRALVGKVTISMHVDNDPDQDPDAVQFTIVTSPRGT